MKKYLVLVNFKAYEEGTGKKGLKLAKSLDNFKLEKYQLAAAPQLADLKEISKKVRIPVFAQHLDGVSYGADTGSVLPEAVKEAGAKGALLNHSEKRISLGEIREGIEAGRKAGLVLVVCASSLRMVKKVARLGPGYIAYEPRKLIGGNVSVTSANPKVILKAVGLVKKINPKIKLLCGAGIHTKRDILKALELGAEGVLVAHKVVKAKKVEKVLKGLLG